MGNLFPKLYDIAMKPLERTKLKKVRKLLINNASGRVLEIGSGTGVNFPYYTNALRVDAIEPNPSMRNRSLNKESSTVIQTYLIGAEKLPFADNTFDSVVGTLVFCTIPEPNSALKEIQRVSKPGTKILLLEHVKVNNKFLSKMQDILTPIWKKVCDGCHLNRNTLDLVEKSGLSISKKSSFYGGIFITIECINE
ncbi:class I SAM-dependent methyltransferase [Aquibacillus saliphilus]|uniref:class I SAM-dependent methyltransferase n=1 Tax=Aquibacillus saliphilus TaxID=1909422 RepID=UPI001CF0D3C7|nr:class I SAM-dependent methyltransferase [Aquibacillus saliphilus]